jgi:hypothetical protein
MATLRSIVAVIAGVILGSLVNMALIMASSYVIPPPAGADMTTAEGLGAAMHLMERIDSLKITLLKGRCLI